MNNINNIVIAGGGTAGWLTALAVHSYLPDRNIVLIESDEIGILGAGEGTVPHFVYTMLPIINLKLEDLINNVKATIKSSIKFTNWSNKKEHYYHIFDGHRNSSLDVLNNIKYNTTSNLLTSLFRENKSLNDNEFISMLCEEGKVPFLEKENEYEFVGAHAVHFDARALASYLKKVALERGVKRKEGIINSFKTKNKNISKVVLKDGEEIESDFIFDCTGQQRLIIGKHYNSKWKSYKDNLPVNRALPFFIPYSEDHNPAPYTEAIAMKYGWIWKIPVQGRYGCGYVFDSHYISDEEALKEAAEYFNTEINSPKQFSFEAGTYEEIWKNNCVAVGLSQGFIEPLEATSIFVSCLTLLDVLSDISFLEKYNQNYVDEINLRFRSRMQEILDFIYFHYITTRSDTDFWKNFTSNNKMPDTLQDRLQRWKYRVPNNLDDKPEHIFGKENWLQVGQGIHYYNDKIFNDYYSNNKIVDKEFINKAQKYINETNQLKNKCVYHNNFIYNILN